MAHIVLVSTMRHYNCYKTRILFDRVQNTAYHNLVAILSISEMDSPGDFSGEIFTFQIFNFSDKISISERIAISLKCIWKPQWGAVGETLGSFSISCTFFTTLIFPAVGGGREFWWCPLYGASVVVHAWCVIVSFSVHYCLLLLGAGFRQAYSLQQMS